MIIKDCSTNKVLNVIKIEINGDMFGWDIWYVDEEMEYYHKTTVEVIKSDKRVDKFIKQIMKFKDCGLYYKFNYTIE